MIKRFVVSDFLFNKNLREFIEHIGLFMISSSLVMREHYVIHIGVIHIGERERERE